MYRVFGWNATSSLLIRAKVMHYNKLIYLNVKKGHQAFDRFSLKFNCLLSLLKFQKFHTCKLRALYAFENIQTKYTIISGF